MGINNRIQICKLLHTFGSEIPPLGNHFFDTDISSLGKCFFFFFWLPTVSSELENILKRKMEIHFSLFPEGSYRSAGETNHTELQYTEKETLSCSPSKRSLSAALLHPYCTSHIALQQKQIDQLAIVFNVQFPFVLWVP